MRVVEQVLDVYERFAEEQAPMAMSDLARALDMPTSTCSNLLRTFERRGFIYQTGQRRALYPTKRMLMLAQDIARQDPVSTSVSQRLAALRDEAEETVLLATRQRDRVLYLDVIETTQPIRYSAAIGETRPIQNNSSGKALLSLMPQAERQALITGLPFHRQTEQTLVSAHEYLNDVQRSASRGWFLNDGESVADLLALAVPLNLHHSNFAVAIAGPRYRMAGRIEALASMLKTACDDLTTQGQDTGRDAGAKEPH